MAMSTKIALAITLFTYAPNLARASLCTSCFVNEVQEVLKSECAESGLVLAEDVLKKQMSSYLGSILSTADIDAALSVTKNTTASIIESIATQACTGCFDSVIAKLSNSKCDPSTCWVKSLATASHAFDWWVDQEAECKAAVRHYIDEPTTTPTAAGTGAGEGQDVKVADHLLHKGTNMDEHGNMEASNAIDTTIGSLASISLAIGLAHTGFLSVAVL